MKDLVPTLKTRLSLALKERLLRHYLIPYSRTGLPRGLVRVLKPRVPITLVDVGASRGAFAGSVDQYSGVRRGLLIEPQPARAKELKRHFREGVWDVCQCAVANSEGTCEFQILNYDYSSSILPVLPNVGGSGEVIDLGVREIVTVPVCTLDSLLASIGWTERIDVLKCDIQGAELLALQGGTNALRQTHFVWLEVSFIELYGGSAIFPDIHRFMYESGFYMGAIEEGFRGRNGELLQADALFVRRCSA